MQEFKVQANSFDAQFGRTSGGVVNIISKSGTNQYHGVLYDFERHSVLDANDFFNNRSGQKRLSFQRHQFGANAGGPVLKSKWFLFGDYEGLRQGYPVSDALDGSHRPTTGGQLLADICQQWLIDSGL